MTHRPKYQPQRPPCQRKQGKPGTKTQRGCPELYDQKKQQFNVTLTPQTVAILADLATLIGESRSQVIEKAIRGEINLLHLLEKREYLVEKIE